MTLRQRIIKSIFDRSLALILFALSLPILLVAAILIKLSSRGSVLFKQTRVGLGENPFQIFKLRTMHLEAEQHPLGTVTVKDDPRVFAVGRWLRRLKIDELPQLINVIMGNMSLVGPRPIVADEYQKMTVAQRQRANVLPGITGLAQINGAAGLMWPERIKLDLQYIDRYSILMDCKIVAITAWLVLTQQADDNPLQGDQWPTDEAEMETRKAA